MSFWFILKNGIKGFSNYRILYLLKIKTLNLSLKGKILDLASGGRDEDGEYLTFIKKRNYKVFRSDLEKRKNIDFQIDLNKKFPLKTNEYENILLFNSLMYVKNYRNCLNEIYRSLKIGGNFIGTSNLIFGISYEPKDYWRLTYDNLNETLKEVGFSKVKIYPIGGHFSSAFFLVREFFYFRIIKTLFSILCYYLDIVGNKVNKNNPCPIGYLIICKK